MLIRIYQWCSDNNTQASVIAKYVVEAISRSSVYLVVNEAEDFVLKALEPVPQEGVEPFRRDRLVWRKISRIFEKVGGNTILGRAMCLQR